MTAKISMSGRLLAFAAVVVALVVGILVLGRISDNATVSMGLTAAWFGLVFVLAASLALRRRELLWPLAVGYGAVAVAAAVLVIAPTLFDKEVNERVVSARQAGNSQIAAGAFQSIAHEGTGNATVVELAGGERVLTLTDFETDSGPDLRLYVSTGDPATGDLGDFEDLGEL